MKPLPETAWDPWSPEDLALRLGRGKADWYVVGGWALDLWHGRRTRDHGDLEFACLPEQIESHRATLSELEFFVTRAGVLTHLPSASSAPADVWQLWGADLRAGQWRVDMMVEQGTPDHWVYKRDPSLRLPRTLAIRKNEDGIPYLSPSLVLLFKAKHIRHKDQHDFDSALPRLDIHERSQLRYWLEMLHPEHDWLRILCADVSNCV
jgi:hypothetical protein